MSVVLFLSVVCDALLNNRYSIHLTAGEIKFMNQLTQDHPEFFETITTTLSDIMSDGQVNIYDLPKIVLLVSKIYHNHLVENVVAHISVTNLVKFTLHVWLDSGLVPLTETEIADMRKSVDGSIDLLATNMEIVHTKCSSIWSCLSRLFRKSVSAPAPAPATTPLASQGKSCTCNPCACTPCECAKEPAAAAAPTTTTCCECMPLCQCMPLCNCSYLHLRCSKNGAPCDEDKKQI